ncbi:hypothetical protein QBC47DRAFT_338949 [Echria macrotheca]|uniref:EKC/KEOPS complex subunit BUD32 n=1 Tax=Echria macrotheca TaxID=438768 RepID=A0AAJ0F7N5_9PEZI|nr:hypothetical protein QBC47DRAFT_338949 [Echria macrotheca]
MLSGEQRFGFAYRPKFQLDVCDYDQRLMVRIVVPHVGENPELDGIRENFETTEALATDIARQYLDGETLDMKTYAGVEIGDTISLSGEHFPLDEFQGARPVGTISRSSLTELVRFKRGVDKCSYMEGDTERVVVIKYSCFPVQGIKDYWNELNVMLRLPPDPAFLQIDRLIVDEHDPSSVIGFTTPYVEGSDLGRGWQGRHFKIDWMRQLMRAVDKLNLEYGIVHQDLAGRNFLLDEKEDRVILCDFHLASRLEDATNPETDDVKGLLLAVHDLITHDDRYFAKGLWELDETELTQKWQKHEKVTLDADVSVYKSEIMEWVAWRRSDKMRNVRAPYQINWPSLPNIKTTADSGSDVSWLCNADQRMPGMRHYCDYYELMKRREKQAGFLDWQRPAVDKIDRARRLLSTGKYA